MKLLNLIANILLIIGGINLGLIGLAQYDFIGMLFQHSIGAIRVIYTLIGIAAIVKILLLTVLAKKVRK